jgi:hypothetical protein
VGVHNRSRNSARSYSRFKLTHHQSPVKLSYQNVGTVKFPVTDNAVSQDLSGFSGKPVQNKCPFAKVTQSQDCLRVCRNPHDSDRFQTESSISRKEIFAELAVTCRANALIRDIYRFSAKLREFTNSLVRVGCHQGSDCHAEGQVRSGDFKSKIFRYRLHAPVN